MGRVRHWLDVIRATDRWITRPGPPSGMEDIDEASSSRRATSMGVGSSQVQHVRDPADPALGCELDDIGAGLADRWVATFRRPGDGQASCKQPRAARGPDPEARLFSVGRDDQRNERARPDHTFGHLVVGVEMYLSVTAQDER